MTSISGRNLALVVILALVVVLAVVWLDTSSRQEQTKLPVVKEEKIAEQIEATSRVEESDATVVKAEELPVPAVQQEPLILLNLFENETLLIALICRKDVCSFMDANTTQPIYIKITQYAKTLDIHPLDLNTTFIKAATGLDFMVKEKQKNLLTFGSASLLSQMDANRSHIVHLSIDTDPIGVEIMERPQYKIPKKISFDANATLDPKKTYYINGYRLNLIENSRSAEKADGKHIKQLLSTQNQ